MSSMLGTMGKYESLETKSESLETKRMVPVALAVDAVTARATGTILLVSRLSYLPIVPSMLLVS